MLTTTHSSDTEEQRLNKLARALRVSLRPANWSWEHWAAWLSLFAADKERAMAELHERVGRTVQALTGRGAAFEGCRVVAGVGSKGEDMIRSYLDACYPQTPISALM